MTRRRTTRPRITRPARVIVDEFHHYLDEAKRGEWEDEIKCMDKPERYVDYIIPPTEDEAEALCAGCPMRALCAEFAAATKPGTGVWGGERWKYGRVLRDGSVLAA